METPRTLAQSLSGQKVLLVASTGGHLTQLHRLQQSWNLAEGSRWVTFDKPQSRALVADDAHSFIPYISPRDLRGVLDGRRRIEAILKAESFDAVISTGAAIALSSHPLALRKGIRSVYIESVSRLAGPSLSGRLLSLLPGIELYAQHPGYPSRWVNEFSILDTYPERVADGSVVPGRVFVTLGTIAPYRFDSLVDAVSSALAPNTDVVWQLGVTDRIDLPGIMHDELDAAQFAAEIGQADLVITHAGVGTVVSLLDAGKPMLVVPRRRSRREHVDDHQTQISDALLERRLAEVCEVEDLSAAVIARATGRRTSYAR